ncbi:MAG: DNA polymerase III subunit alpha [Alphaproteobacteria bacterium]|nr:DNA polymerase III subunit alpha [Alphaproteobacteria bacterium]
MPHADFVHLRVHSAFSLSEGAIHIKDLAELCRHGEMPALAITDTGNLFGALEFSEAMINAGVQPIIGAAMALRSGEGEAGARHGAVDTEPDRLILLVQSEAGYENLSRLSSKAYLESEGGATPQIDLRDLRQWSDGLICLSGGADGPLGRLLRAGQAEQGRALLRELNEAFPGRLYIELQRHGLPEEAACEGTMIDLAYEFDLPLVATNDVHFADPDMYEAHDALLCIAQKNTVSQTERRRLTAQHYFRSSREMRALFADLPEALDNTLVIARRCAYRVPMREPILPNFGEGGDEQAVMRAMAEEGLAERMADIGIELASEQAQPYKERLAFELDVIVNMGFAGYFLIVADFIQWAKAQAIPVGPGRGSGAGSVVAWALKITDLDPLRFGLLFERFLNPERVSMPDFDIDFCQDKRDQVIRYVQEKYGHDQVAQIITFGKLQARAALRDVGRVLEMPFGLVDRLCKMVPNNPANPTTLPEALKAEPRIKQVMREEPGVDRLFDVAMKLEGLYRHASTHAAGVVIGDRPLEQLVPLYRDPHSDMPVTQFNMKWVEPAGLVKFDFLGLKTLTVLDRAVEMIHRRVPDFDLAHIPLDDKASFDLIARGETVGVFQLEGAGMRDTLRQMQPDCFEDIIAVVALYRPGPMDNIPRFCNVKSGAEQADYLHPCLEGILTETYGVIVYQEQVMQIAQVMAGYSLGDADLLRRAMGKKIQAEMDAQRSRFVEGAVANGIDGDRAEYVFDLVNKFAGYGFNKSHAAAYALIAYQTAYLKANHPVEFMAATMSLDLTNTDKLNQFKQEVKRMGIILLPPDLNKSDVVFTVAQDDRGDGGGDDKGAIHYALAAVKNVGREAMAAVIAERQAHGPFKDIWDFAGRLDPHQVNKRQVENLARAGAFDALNPNRAQVLAAAETLLRHAGAVMADKESGQGGLFDDAGTDAAPPPLPVVTEWQQLDKLANEAQAIGFYLSAHPLESYPSLLARKSMVDFAELEARADQGGQHFRIAATIEDVNERKSAKGNPFAFLDVSDQTGTFDVAVFGDDLTASRDLLIKGASIVMTVDVRDGDKGRRLIASQITDIDTASQTVAGGIKVFLKNPDPLASLRHLLEDHKGRGQVTLLLELAEKGREVEMALPGGFAITPQVRGALKAIPGVMDVHDV